MEHTKLTYEQAELEIVDVCASDIICTSDVLGGATVSPLTPSSEEW